MEQTPGTQPVTETSPNPPAFTADSQKQMQMLGLHAAFKRGIDWFYWIAGLSLVNSILGLTGAGWSFIVGLGATQLVDGIVLGVSEEAQAGNAMKLAAFGVDLVIAGIYALIGFLGLKGIKAAIIAGMVLYAIDGLVFLMVKDFLSIGFHVFVLYCIFSGLKALNQLEQAQREPAGQVRL